MHRSSCRLECIALIADDLVVSNEQVSAAAAGWCWGYTACLVSVLVAADRHEVLLKYTFSFS